MKTKNEYPDIPEFIVRLVKSTARDMQRFRHSTPQDREDHEQEIMLHILRMTSKMGNIGDLSEDDVRALIATYIDHRKLEIVRKQANLAEKETCYPEFHDGPSGAFENNSILKADIERAFKKLTPQQKRVVSMLYHGFGVTEIAEKLHISPAAVNCYIRRAGDVFKREGLDSYLQN
jgi:RNA polymerase sigma factor (sigma-70 family)